MNITPILSRSQSYVSYKDIGYIKSQDSNLEEYENISTDNKQMHLTFLIDILQAPLKRNSINNAVFEMFQCMLEFKKARSESPKKIQIEKLENLNVAIRSLMLSERETEKVMEIVYSLMKNRNPSWFGGVKITNSVIALFEATGFTSHVKRVDKSDIGRLCTIYPLYKWMLKHVNKDHGYKLTRK